ncbi:MAG: hypothetical protein ACTSU5_09130 [Promethearchaeota archaeon]
MQIFWWIPLMGAGALLAVAASKIHGRLAKWSRGRYQPERATRYTCEDGHVVRSRGEMVIDNYFSRRQIAHVYEKTVKVLGKPVKYDWYLQDLECYVEYWGYGGKEYARRKREKLRLYRAAGLKLLSIEDKALEDIYAFMEDALGKILGKDPGKTPRSGERAGRGHSFCPNCGCRLDERFSV